MRVRCKECGHDTFLRYAEEEVSITHTREGIVDELVGGFTQYDYKCAKCKAVTTLE